MSIMHQRRIFKKEAIFEPDTNSTSKQSSAKSHEKRGLLARSQATRKLCFSDERRQSFEYEIKQKNNFSVGKD